MTEEWELIGAVDSASYRTFSMIYLAFLSIWLILGFFWVSCSWRSCDSQMKNLHLVLTSVTMIKSMQLASSFLFWYSCVDLKICSLWMSFGAFVSGIMFQTLSFVTFMLISHGYCITCARLSRTERRRTAVLALFFYLALVGYKTALPYCNVILMGSYSTSFFIIFGRVSQNLVKLKELMRSIEEEGVDLMQDILRFNYTMFKKFRSAMQILFLMEIILYIQVLDSSYYHHWVVLFFREWTSFCIFLYVSFTFRRPQQFTSDFWVSQSLSPKLNRTLAPIYTIEMDSWDFKHLTSPTWQVGLPTSSKWCHGRRNFGEVSPPVILVQHPGFGSSSQNQIFPNLVDSSVIDFELSRN
ncbi:hypothetical protein ZOSMA_154G00080 [Zostera marina]|uniref:Transmembrane protein n=1 Tax=Zostera marina TaxID=29655 RepID=A0A0K9PVP7_ZOSMR|nr:hypothetical protein ZOSMA_154G00080 [Zostera marina]